MRAGVADPESESLRAEAEGRRGEAARAAAALESLVKLDEEEEKLSQVSPLVIATQHPS